MTHILGSKITPPPKTYLIAMNKGDTSIGGVTV